VSFLRQRLLPLLNSQVSRDSIKILILKITGTGLSFISVVLLSRNLGTDGYGIYTYIIAIVSVLSIPASAGLPQLVIRETSRNLAINEPSKVRGLWQWATGVVIKNSIFVIILAIITILLYSKAEENAGIILWALILVPLSALSDLRSSCLTGLQKIGLGQLPELLIRPGIFVLILFTFTILFNINLTPQKAMAMNVFSAFLGFIAGAWLLLRHTPLGIKGTKPFYESQAWRSSLWSFSMLAGINALYSNIDVIILGLFLSAKDVGIYKIASQMAIFASFGLQAINVAVGPRFARLYALSEKEKLQRLVTLSARAVLFFNLFVTLFFIIAGKKLLSLVFGTAFVESYEPLLILLIGQFVNSAAGSVGLILNMTGHENDTVKGRTIALITNIVLNFTLIPILGLIGSAIATAMSMIVWNTILWWIVWKKTGINSLAFGRGLGL
jgi:O-antigen/teichoic acid export membrane protein